MTAEARVVEASLRGWVCAYERYEDSPFQLGELVAVREGRHAVFGAVANVESGPDDAGRPLQHRGEPGQPAAEVFRDNPELGLLLRTRVTVVACGHVEGEDVRAALPPTPPPLLGLVQPATAGEAVRVSEGGHFLALLLASPVCDDAVIAAAIRGAARSHREPRAYMVSAGKELARMLRADPARLTSILRAVAP